jgi:hypothetical protein
MAVLIATTAQVKIPRRIDLAKERRLAIVRREAVQAHRKERAGLRAT